MLIAIIIILMAVSLLCLLANARTLGKVLHSPTTFVAFCVANADTVWTVSVVELFEMFT